MNSFFNLNRLTFVYFIVFISLVFWAFFAFTTMNQMISSQKIYAKIINIAGKQRMLSQRAALMAKMSFENKDEISFQKTYELLLNMKRDHKFIVSKLTSEKLRNIYLEKPYELNYYVNEYFKLFELFLTNRDKSSLLKIEKYSNELLPKLDFAVKAFERESDKKIEALVKQELFILIGTLLTIIFEAILIVIPSLKYNRQKEKELKELNKSLEKRIEEEIKKTKAQDLIIAEHTKNATMKDILNNIAHKWKQPLSIISTCASGLKLKKDYCDLNEKDLDKNIDIILNYSNTLASTIDTFKEFFDEQGSTFYNMKSIVKKAVELLSHKLENKKINIVQNIEDINYYGEETKLIQAIIHILNNIIDSMKTKESEKYVFIDIKKDLDTVLIEIFDNSSTFINKENLFEPHFSKENSNERKGIDLYNSKLIIEAIFNGTILVENKLRKYDKKSFKGLSFKITLPLKL